MSTVFTLSGLFNILPLMEYRLEGDITEGNTVVDIAYPSWGLDTLLLSYGPQIMPAEALASINTGAAMLNTALTSTPGDKIVFGHSGGAMVSAAWARIYGPTSAIPPADLSFVFIGNPLRKYGGILYDNDYAMPEDVDYPVRDMTIQYEGYSDWPSNMDSPYWLLATQTALLGAQILHPWYINYPAYDESYLSHIEGNIEYVFIPQRPWWVPEYVMERIETAYHRPELDSAGSVTPAVARQFGPTIRLPRNPVTPHGAYQILRDRVPMVALRAYDDSVVCNLMGGLAIPDRQTPERVELTGLKGLVPPWQTIDQKGATQDGITFIDALYDGIEVDMDVVCHGRDPRRCRETTNLLIASIDAKKESTLSWFTHEMGYWWAPVRWFKPPPNPMGKPSKRQALSLHLRADSAFWRSYPYVSQYRFDYAGTGDDDFEEEFPGGLNSTLWTTAYSGTGSGAVSVNDGVVMSTLNNRTMTARRKVYTSATDNQVVEITMGTFGQWFYHFDTAVDIWARMANTGTVGANGVRLRLERHKLTVSSFNAGVETVLRERFMLIPPLPGEKWTFIAGTPALGGLILTDPRRFKVLRNGLPIMLFEESGTTSQIGAGFRSIGFGLHTATDKDPATIQHFNAGGNIVETQSGFVKMINAGDQDMWIEYTAFGPFDKIKIWDGPNAAANEYVEFGPLNSNQVVQIRTDPRKYGVKDLTSSPNTPLEEELQRNLLDELVSFYSANNITNIIENIASIFSLFNISSAPTPPQGNLYRLLKGRFSKSIPAKSPGNPAGVHHVKVEIVNGHADSHVIATGVPLRRYPY